MAKDERINQYRAIVDMQKEGLIKNIGVSNWNIRHIEEIKAANLPLPAANQIELHPLCCAKELIQYMKENNILPIAYSSLAPCSDWRILPEHASGKPSLIETNATAFTQYKTLADNITKKYNITEAQMLLRWGLQHGYPILPKSTKTARILENASLYHFVLSDDDTSALDGLDCNLALAWSSVGNPLDCD